MTDRFRSALGIGLLMVGVLGLEAVGLRSGTIGLILLGLIAAIAAVIVVVRVELKWAAMITVLLAAFTISWNGWFIGPVRPGDVLVLLALIGFVLADPNASLRWPPWWVKQLGVMIALVAVIHVFFPASDDYLTHRIVLNAQGRPVASYKGSLTMAGLGVGVKFIIATVFVALAFAAAVRVDKRAVRWLTIAFVTGTALSGLAAFLGSHGFIALTKLIVRGGHACSSASGSNCAAIRNPFGGGGGGGGNRQLGFSNHPNFLAASLVIAVPLAIWLIAKRDRSRFDLIVGSVSLPVLLLGVYASGSRGGTVCVVGAVGLAVIAFPRTRQYLPGWLLAGAVMVGVVLAVVPSLGDAILRATRLRGNKAATSGSDLVRHIVGHQGVLDFQHAPIHGVGLQVSFEASQVYLQELASGGLLLFVAMSVYMLGGIVSAYRLIPENDLAAAVFTSLIAMLALNFFEADLTDRFYYVPVAILVAFLHTRDPEPHEESELESMPGQPGWHTPGVRPPAMTS